MKLLFVCIGLFAQSAAVALNAQEATHGRISFVCAVSTPGKGFLEVDGNDLLPSGFAPGRSTGWIKLRAGKHHFRAEQQPGGQAELEVELAPDGGTVIILHTVFVPSDKPGRPPRPELRLTAVDHAPRGQTDKPRLLKVHNTLADLVVLATDQPEVPELKVEPGKLLTTGFKGPVGFISLSQKSETPALEPLISLNFQEPSAFFVILYQAENGKLSALSLEAP